MSANTETTGAPPKGYVRCSEKCGRWTNSGKCWTCCARLDGLADVHQSPHTPDWTPPIAAPAAHIERRKGQVWRLTQPDGHSKDYTLSHRYGDTRWACVGFGDCGLEDVCWEGRYEMTLLADAPPEPLTAKDVFGEIPPGSKLTNDTPVKFASAPTAQEAPKAAPVAVCIDCDTAPIDRPVPMRFVGLIHRARPICDDCYLVRESHIGDHDYTPYAGPERLPSPQLAADWAEDCLPTVWR